MDSGWPEGRKPTVEAAQRCRLPLSVSVPEHTTSLACNNIALCPQTW